MRPQQNIQEPKIHTEKTQSLLRPPASRQNGLIRICVNMSIGQSVTELAIFRFFKMAAVRRLGFLEIWNFNYSSGYDVLRASPCRISCRRDSPLLRYGHFLILRWRPSAFFNFQKLKILTAVKVQWVNVRQIWCWSDNPLQRYGNFSIFQDGGRPPYWIYRHIGTTNEEYLMVSVIV